MNKNLIHLFLISAICISIYAMEERENNNIMPETYLDQDEIQDTNLIDIMDLDPQQNIETDIEDEFYVLLPEKHKETEVNKITDQDSAVMEIVSNILCALSKESNTVISTSSPTTNQSNSKKRKRKANIKNLRKSKRRRKIHCHYCRDLFKSDSALNEHRKKGCSFSWLDKD